MEMNSGHRVSEVPLLASLLPPSPGSQRQVDLAPSQLLRISASCRRRIWQSEGCWLPDRIHQIHFPDAIASDAERKIGCPEMEVGKDERSWEMHSDTQNNKGLFLFNSLAYLFEYSWGSYIPQIPYSVPGGASSDISGYTVPHSSVLNGIRSVKISHGSNSEWVRVGLHHFLVPTTASPIPDGASRARLLCILVVLKGSFFLVTFCPDIPGSSPALIWNSNQGKSLLKILVLACIFTMK